MTFGTLFFGFSAVALAVLALAAMAGTGHVGRPARAVAVGLAAATLGGAYFAGTELLGRPKPARLSLLERGAETATLAGSHYIEGKAIFLWLLLPGQSVPRAYALPWSREAAEALRDARAEAAETGTGVEVEMPFRRRGEDSAPSFHATPQPPRPVKTSG